MILNVEKIDIKYCRLIYIEELKALGELSFSLYHRNCNIKFISEKLKIDIEKYLLIAVTDHSGLFKIILNKKNKETNSPFRLLNNYPIGGVGNIYSFNEFNYFLDYFFSDKTYFKFQEFYDKNF